HGPHSSDNDKLLKTNPPDLCYGCHDQGKFTKKDVHPAIKKAGCTGCHSPHSSKNDKLLKTAPPDLCYGCHDKGTFTKKDIHPAIDMVGCTGCHSPHSSKNERLLKAKPPELCFTCHDKGIFSKKTVHPPVAAGMCLGCHSPHSSDQMALLLSAPVEVCLGCHPNIPGAPHVVKVFSGTSHPLGLQKMEANTGSEEAKKGAVAVKEKPALMDPLRPDKVFYCGSCHNPHSTATPNLFRFNATSTMGLCANCHSVVGPR
ncbi:MAG: hypothetical protein M0Z89_01705, partial [Nitrospiraceae bacterium]|nr:hypothetical protein [Nitrospiraceae bacterium]